MNRIRKLLNHGFEFFNNKDYGNAYNTAKLVLNSRYNIDALALAGTSLFKLGEIEKAEEYIAKAFNENPNNKSLQIYYLDSLLKLSKYEKGIEVLKKIKLKGFNVNLIGAKLYQLNGLFSEAINLIQNISPCIEKFEIMAWNYEKLNLNVKARKNAKHGLKLDPPNLICNIILTKLFLRRKKIKKAKKQIKRIKKKRLNATNLSIYYSTKAEIFEKNQQYNKAFRGYTKSNNALKNTTEFLNLKGHNYYTFEKINLIKEYFSKKISFNNSIPSREEITFMVGFPRSGTTLLENILNSHTKITTIEEKPLLDEIFSLFLNDLASMNRLTDLSREELLSLQKTYLTNRTNYSKSQKGLIIDKLPLNIIHIGIIYRIFPNAKFIISTRDVRDVALSCYFQNFAVNDAMANFLDWNTTKKYLEEIMQLGMKLIKEYSANHIIVNYEDFVNAPFKKVREILTFLDLEWQDEILNYRKKIVGKNINTPSYEKVSQKITLKQTNKWKNYTKYFKD